MKVVVSGGTGFIGSHLVNALVEKGHQVICAARRDPGANPRTDRVGHVLMDDILSGAHDLSGTDAFFHLAAIRHRWGASDAQYLSSNVALTSQLLDRCEGRVKHFIYCSSIAVLGWPPRGPIDESFPYSPINAYGESKVHCERMVLSRDRMQKTRGTVIRPSITYGRRDPTGMLTKLAVMIDRGIYATVGSGKNRVQLAHVDDVIQGFLRVLNNTRSYGRSYIITGREPISINRLVALVANTLGKPCPRLKIPQPAAYTAAVLLEALYAMGLRVTGAEPIIAREKIQVMSVDRSYSIDRAENELGYAPQFDYESGVRDFVAGLRTDGLLKPAGSSSLKESVPLTHLSRNGSE